MSSAYSATLAASGGTPPYAWSVVSGQLPAGLALSGAGVISGTPTASGTFSFTVQARDSATSPQTATRAESIAVAAAPSTGPTPPPQISGYHLAFEDNFNTLNLSPTGLGNYTWYEGQWWQSKLPPMSAISVANSILTLDWNSSITAPQLDLVTASHDGQYYRAWRYGYFEARFKWQNKTTGAWPAFWMIPIQNIYGPSTFGELDIMEGQGGAYPNTVFVNMHNWLNGTDIGNLNSTSAYTVPSSVDLSQYHTYGALWTPGRVTWYLDDQPIKSANTYPIFDSQDYYLLLTNQVGANWSLGNMSGVTASDIQMNVDWVRVWQQ